MKSWKAFGSTINKLNDIYHDINDSGPFKLHMQLVNSEVYQKGLCEAEFKLTTPPVLRGILVLQLLKPTKIRDLSVKFQGYQKETTVDFDVSDTGEPILPRKKKISKVLVDQLFSWDYQSVDDIVVGTYTFPFHFIVDTLLPATYCGRYVNIGYSVEACLKYEHRPCDIREITKTEEIKLIKCIPDTLFNPSILATGNWRDLLVYEFSFENKIAFQNSPYLSILSVYPLQQDKAYFMLHGLSIWLIQTLSFDKLETDLPKNYEETDRFLLYKKQHCMNSLDKEDSLYDFEIELNIPTCGSIVTKENQRLKKTIYPTIQAKNTGFISSHSLKVMFEVSEKDKNKGTTFKSNLAVSRTPSSMSAATEKSVEIECTIPGYSTFHEKRTDSTRYKKIELSFTAPIKLLSKDSNFASASPPMYSSMKPSPTISGKQLVSHNKCNIVPPTYNEIAL